ncbi:MAG TPA: hypothetical protein VFJ16_23400 [Longimicrobium sp.]|nr:hypothetical protein [Longimicrobium sp.]
MNIHVENARRMLEEWRPDPAVREELRKKTLLALLVANNIRVPNADRLDSAALRRVLDAATDKAAAHNNGH